MRRALALLAGVLLAPAVIAAEGWSSLWLNPDQRGERLLQQGDAAAAASTYSDPRRKAYAELKAGDAAGAARDLTGLDDGDGHYNRGNALVQAGDLKAALQAYDSALSHDPANQDAKHNRDLVAQALKRQQEQSQPDSDKKQDKKQNDKPDDKGDNKHSKDQPGGESNGDPDSSAQDKTGDSKPQDGKQAQGDPGDGDKPGQPAPNPAKDSPSDPAKKDAADQARRNAPETPPKPGDEAAEARRDAEASLAKKGTNPQPQPEGTGAKADGSQPGVETTMPTPGTEQQLGQEQWLRQIPDDPGGLLRRKFVIEHLQRQQQSQTPP